MSRLVVVGMSGGVDSSVAAALLAREGYDVVGCTMLLAEGEDASEAAAVCGRLGVSHEVLDARRAFAREVVGRFLDEYAAGRTPNPCTYCNDAFKFGRLIDHASSLSDDALVATGHYASVARGGGGEVLLMRGADESKDQSYALFMLDQRRLSRVLFPLGELTKTEVRDEARRLGLPCAEGGESQDVCFVPAGSDYRDLFLRMRPGEERPGEIVHVSGRVLGSHDGVHGFTVGQRRGLGVGGGGPFYVVRIDAGAARVVVGSEADLLAGSCVVEGVSFVSEEKPTGPFRCQIQVRYNQRARSAYCRLVGRDVAEVCFQEPIAAVTPGQALVFYNGRVVLGGGYITSWKLLL